MKGSIKEAEVDDSRDVHQPGFTEWQTAHAQMCLSIIQDDDVLRKQTGDLTSSAVVGGKTGVVEIEERFGQSCAVSSIDGHERMSEDAINAGTSSDGSSRTKEDEGDTSITSGERGEDVVISTLLGFLSSPYYEVRTLALETIFEDHHRSHLDHASSSDRDQSMLWSKVTESQEVFQCLVTMVMNGEDHPGCIETVSKVT